MMDWTKKFTQNEIERLMDRRSRKVKNASNRGISFTLSKDDWLMMGEKLLGNGNCDYCDLPFNTTHVNGETGPFFPSVERIDDKKGYIRGNVCVVAHRANQLKDNLVDKQTATTIIDPIDRDIVRGLMLNMSKDHMEKLKTKYIPQEEEQEMNTDEIMQKSDNNISMPMGVTGAMGPKEVGNWSHPEYGVTDKEKPSADPVVEEEKQKLPDDVAVALAYANYCKTFADVGMNVSVTYAQFKAKYTRNTCSLTQEKLSGEPKAILIMDLNVGFAKDNFIIVSKKMEKALTQLMISTQLSLPKIAAMLNKVV